MKTFSQNTNKEGSRCILNARIFWKILVLAISTVVFFVMFSWLGMYAISFIESTATSTVGYVDAKIKQEQAAYYSDAKKILFEIEKNMWVIDEYIEKLEENRVLSIEEKKELNSELKKLEENSILLQRKFDEYFDDLTIQAYPRSSNEITSFIYEIGNFSIAIDRFVRTLELNIFLTQRYRQDQIELILENYYDLIWYLDHLEIIKR